MTIHGVCFCTVVNGRDHLWTGSFVDSCGKESIEECRRKAMELQTIGTPLPDGRVVCVSLTIDEEATARIIGQ